MANSLVDGEKFSVEGEVVYFCLKEFVTEETQNAWLSTSDLFQNIVNGDVAGVRGVVRMRGLSGGGKARRA